MMWFAAKTMKSFQREEDGNITVFSVFMLILILTITGASVDIMRFEAVRAKMQSTMDRAVLAATDLDQKQDPVAVVEDYMTKAGIIDVLADVKVEEKANSRTVTAWGTAEMDTIFLHMSGFDTMTAPSLSMAEEKIANVEVSLVLDISGSMRFNDRILKMKPAAQAFVDKVMAEDTNGVTTLNVVPFAGQVNPGDILFDYFRGERPTLPEEPESEEPEVAEDNGDYFTPWTQAISNIVIYFDTDGDDVYNVAHKIQGWPESAPRDLDEYYKGAVAYVMSRDSRLTDPQQFLGISIKGGNRKKNPTQYFQVKGDENGPASDLGPTKNKGKIPGSTFSYGEFNQANYAATYVSPNASSEGEDGDAAADPLQNVNMPSSCIEIYDDEFLTTAMPQSSDFVPHFMFWDIAEDVMDWGWCPGEDTAIQYYSADKEALKTFIGDMRMHDGTGTQYGMKYGLALLDPATGDAVNHLVNEGIIEARFAGRPIAWDDPETEKFIVLMTDGQTTDQYRPEDPTAAINGEVELKAQGSDSYYTKFSKNTNIANLMTQCNLAKQKGVTVFTIAYETNSSAADDMKACASSPGHFFHVHGDEIWDAFDTVARQINNLRLIQ